MIQNMENLEMVSMSLLSLLEAGLYLDDTAGYLEAADALIEVLDKWNIDFAEQPIPAQPIELMEELKKIRKDNVNPYGDGVSSKRIIKIEIEDRKHNDAADRHLE